MDSCIALRGLIEGKLDFNDKSAKEIKAYLLAVSTHLNKLSSNSDAMSSIEKIINDKLISEADNKGNISIDTRRDVFILNNMINVDQQELYKMAFEIYSKDSNNEFPLPEQENVVASLTSFLLNNNGFISNFIKKSIGSKKNNTLFKLNNIIKLDAPAGVGKTQFIVKNVLKLYSSMKGGSKDTKIITTASTDIKSGDLHNEVLTTDGVINGINDVIGKAIKFEDLLKKEKELKSAEVLIIDEATLVSYKDLQKIININPDLKIILLGDSKQLGTEYFSGESSSFKVESFITPTITNRFRTSSSLLIDSLKELTDKPGNLLEEGNESNKLTLNYAIRKNSETDEIIGAKDFVTDAETKSERVSSIISAFKDNIIGNESFVDNLLKQAEKRPITINVSIDEIKKGDNSPDALETAMKNDNKLKSLFDNPNIKIRVYSTESIQGSQADYIVAETPIDRRSKGRDTIIDNQNAINMLLSRAKRFAIIVNNKNLNIDSYRKDDNTFDIISNDVIKKKAEQAKNVYSSVVDILDGRTESVLSPEELSIKEISELSDIESVNRYVNINEHNADFKNKDIRLAILNKLKEFKAIEYLDGKSYTSEEVKREFNKIQDLELLSSNYIDLLAEYKTLLEGKFDNFEQQKFDIVIDKLKAVANDIYTKNGEEMTNSEISQELNELDKIENKTNEQNERFSSLYDSIIARIELEKHYKSQSDKQQSVVMDTVDATNEVIANGPDKPTSKEIVDLLQDNGLAYLYSDTEKDSPSKNKLDGLSNKELTSKMEGLYEGDKFTFDLDKSINDLSEGDKGVFKLHILKEGDNFRAVVFKKNGKESNIVSTLFIDKENQGGLYLYKMLDGLLGDRMDVRIDISGKNIIRTAGKVIPTDGNVNIKPTELIKNLNDIDGLVHSGARTIRVKDFDVNTVKYAGRSGIFYTYANESDIDFNSADFLKWATSRNNFSINGGNMLGYYVNNGVAHNIGFIPFNNKNHSISDLRNIIKSSQNSGGNNIKDTEAIVSEFNTTRNNSKALVELTSLIHSVVSNDNTVSDMFINDNNILFGIGNYSESGIKDLKSNIKEIYDSLDADTKEGVKSLLSVMYSNTGNVVRENGEIKVKRWNDLDMPEINFGNIVTVIPSLRMPNDSESSAIFSFNLFNMITVNQQVNPKTEESVIKFFDKVFESKKDDVSIIPYFNGGINLDVSLNNTQKGMKLAILPSSTDIDNVFDVNIESVQKPAIIVDFVSSVSNGKINGDYDLETTTHKGKPVYTLHDKEPEIKTKEEEKNEEEKRKDTEENSKIEIESEFTEVELLSIPTTDGIMKSFNNDNSDYIKVEHNGIIGDILINDDISSDKIIRLINEFDSKISNIVEPINSYNGATGINIISKGKVKSITNPDGSHGWEIVEKMRVEFTNTGKVIDVSNKEIRPSVITIENQSITVNDPSINTIEDVTEFIFNDPVVSGIIIDTFEDIDEDAFEDPLFNNETPSVKDAKIMGQIILGLTNNNLTLTNEEAIEYVDDIVKVLGKNEKIKNLFSC